MLQAGLESFILIMAILTGMAGTLGCSIVIIFLVTRKRLFIANQLTTTCTGLNYPIQESGNNSKAESNMAYYFCYRHYNKSAIKSRKYNGIV